MITARCPQCLGMNLGHCLLCRGRGKVQVLPLPDDSPQPDLEIPCSRPSCSPPPLPEPAPDSAEATPQSRPYHSPESIPRPRPMFYDPSAHE
jgi:hypothetical protein